MDHLSHPKSCLFPLLGLGPASCPPCQGHTVGPRGKSSRPEAPSHLPKLTSSSSSSIN